MGYYYGNTFGGSGGGYKPPAVWAGAGAGNSPAPEALSFYNGLWGPASGNSSGGPRDIPTTTGSSPDATPTGQKPAMPDLSNLDFSNDPILLRVQGLVSQQNQSADASALAARRQLAIGYGDPALAQKLGLGSDVGKQAGGNTFGTLQELQRGYQRRNVFDINRPLSDQANLFYSSERSRQLGLSGEQYLRDQYGAQAAVQAQLQQLSQQNLQAHLDSQAQLIQAQQDAYGRALQAALASAGA